MSLHRRAPVTDSAAADLPPGHWPLMGRLARRLCRARRPCHWRRL